MSLDSASLSLPICGKSAPPGRGPCSAMNIIHLLERNCFKHNIGSSQGPPSWPLSDPNQLNHTRRFLWQWSEITSCARGGKKNKLLLWNAWNCQWGFSYATRIRHNIDGKNQSASVASVPPSLTTWVKTRTSYESEHNLQSLKTHLTVRCKCFENSWCNFSCGDLGTVSLLFRRPVVDVLDTRLNLNVLLVVWVNTVWNG